jgi:hypothetical protein
VGDRVATSAEYHRTWGTGRTRSALIMCVWGSMYD